MVRNLLLEAQSGKPAPGQMHAQIFDQLALARDAVQIADHDPERFLHLAATLE